MSTGALAPEQRSLVREAAVWRLLGLLFERPRGEWRVEIERLSQEIGDEALAASVRAAGEHASEPLFIEILGPGGFVSPREVAYRRQGEPGHLLAGLQAAYEAFAFTPGTEEPPDHVSVLAGFVGFLLLKEAFARAAGETEAAEIAADAAAHVRREHLARMAQPMLEKLEPEPELYLTMAARLLRERVGEAPDLGALPDAVDVESPCIGCSFE